MSSKSIFSFTKFPQCYTWTKSETACQRNSTSLIWKFTKDYRKDLVMELYFCKFTVHLHLLENVCVINLVKWLRLKRRLGYISEWKIKTIDLQTIFFSMSAKNWQLHFLISFWSLSRYFAIRCVTRGGRGQVSPALFQKYEKSALILGKNVLILVIYGLNFSFKMQFLRVSRNKTGDFSLRGKIYFSCCTGLFIKMP